MATVTDTLETVLKLSGGPQFAAQMAGAAAATGGVAVSANAATGAVTRLNAAMAALGGPLGIALQALIVLGTAGIAGAIKGLNEFAASQENLFRTSILLRNIGSNLPVSELQELGTEIQRLTGFDDDLVISLGGVLARFNVAGTQIPNATRAIADAAAATGRSMDDLGQAFGLALSGQSRGLLQLGIRFKATGDRVKDTTRLVELFNQKFAGAGEGRRQTLAGTFDALKNSMANLFEAIGSVLAPLVVRVLNGLIKVIDFVTEQINKLTNRFPNFFKSGAGIAGDVGVKGDPEQTRLLGEIAGNTGSKLEGIIRDVLGGRGEIARGAFTIRDARIAFGL